MLINRRKDASKADAEAELKPRIELTERDGVHHAVLRGNWTTRRVAAVDSTIRQIEKNKAIKSLHVDLTAVGRFDTAGAWLVERLLSGMRGRGVEPEVSGANEAVGILLGAVQEAARRDGDSAPEPRPNILLRFLEGLGRHMYMIAGDAIAFMYILGATIRGSQMKAGRGHGVNI